MTFTQRMHNVALGLGAMALLCFASQSTQAQSFNLNSGSSVAAGSASESSSAAGFNEEVASLSNGDTLANYLRAEAVGEGVAGQSNYSGGGRSYGSPNTGKLALEFGGGFNGPIGNDTPYITWGGNFTVGAGIHLNRHITLLGEYQFMDDKLPASLIEAVAGAGDNGNAYINSFTVSPVIDLFPRRVDSVYVTGGFGLYLKKTEFSSFAGYDFYGDPYYVTVAEFSSNQLGGNVGMGYTHRLGGIYGDGRAKLYAEVRYLYINTPALGQPNGLGKTELIPVTFGIRW